MLPTTCLQRRSLWSGLKQDFPYTLMAVPCLHPQNSWTRERKDFSVHNLNNLGDSVTCLLQHCLNIPRLPEYSSLIVSTVNGKVTGNVTSIFCHSITCLGTNQCCWVRNHTSVLHECSPVRVCKGAAYDPVSNKNFLYTLVICTWLCHVACIHKTLGQERERTSHFTLEQFRWFSDMSASRLPEYDSLAWVFLA